MELNEQDLTATHIEILRGTSSLNGFVSGITTQAKIKASHDLEDAGYIVTDEDGDTFCDSRGYDWLRENGWNA